MSETIAPCPACGEPGIAISPYHTGCSVCDFVATPDRWSRLSRAAALLRACDAFTGRVRVLPDAFAPGYWFAIHADRQFTSRAPGQTHTDALIALGDLLASPTIGEE